MSHIFPPPPILKSIFTFICILIAFPGSDGDDEMFEACQRRKTCGPLQVIDYPLWGNNSRPEYCGRQGFELICEYNQFPILEIGNQRFRVLAINDTHPIMRIVRDDYLEPEKCPVPFPETNIIITNQNLFNYNENVRNLSFFFDCSSDALSSPDKNIFRCPSEARRDGFYTIDGDSLLKNITNSCSKSIKVPIILNSTDLLGGGWKNVLNRGFEVVYNADNTNCSDCSSSGGICGSNDSTNGFVCFCRGQPNMTSACPAPARAPTPPPPPGEDKNVLLKTGIGLGAAFGGMAIMAAAFFFYLHRKKNKHSSSALFSRNTSSDPFSKSDLEQGDNYLGVHVFSYSELEEATNFFDSAKELGDGGFGTVYFGKLQDGRAVAVKRLYENNYKRVEQFMNEVEILAHLRHQNLVSLYGCTSRHSRELLLVYEYIPNGTVADHLHGERTKPGALLWPTRLKIGIETASALTYLHASDIIHRDVKTNNILLDENFCVKVADFGLSRLFPTHVTHVSTAPQGTPGYVDPEYHQCYQLTDKSDVFSFGVVLIELISSMPAVDITRHRHEINLSNLAINKIQNKALHELVDLSLGYESDYKVRKTINAVAELAFQCLQSEKELRPSMVEVLEILKDIERDGYNTKRTEEMLKQSPDSVTHNWTSTKTTPTSSS